MYYKIIITKNNSLLCADSEVLCERGGPSWTKSDYRC